MTKLRAGVITASTKGARGERPDESGPAMREVLEANGVEVVSTALVPDDVERIAAAIRAAVGAGANVVLTTGGTGLSPSDVTPEATRSVLEREVPGIAEALRARWLEKTAHGMLSRGVAGAVGRTLVVNLPGSPRAVRESLEVLLPVLPHAIELLAGESGEAGHARGRAPASVAMRLAISREVQAALAARQPVVALESTVIAHGLPRPVNLETARSLERIVREAGAVPATIAIADGQAIVGANDDLLTRLASEGTVAKVSLRDLAPVLAGGGLGATTVAASVEIAAQTGIEVLATGGIGGVHRGAERTLDVSADLGAIARNAVCVVCAGAKLVLDLPRTLEVLETLGVPVIGYGTDELPAFYVRSSGLPLAHRADDPIAAARVARAQLQRGAGLVIAVPGPEEQALDRAEVEREVERAVEEARHEGVAGAALTPFLLRAIGEHTEGRSLVANVALLQRNAAVAAAIAKELVRI